MSGSKSRQQRERQDKSSSKGSKKLTFDQLTSVQSTTAKQNAAEQGPHKDHDHTSTEGVSSVALLQETDRSRHTHKPYSLSSFEWKFHATYMKRIQMEAVLFSAFLPPNFMLCSVPCDGLN